MWWEELGRTTLSGAGDTISITSISARKYLKILISVLDTGGTIGPLLRFNNDSGSNYSIRYSDNGAADATAGSQGQIALDAGAPAAYPHFAVVEVVNILAQEKIAIGHTIGRGSTGGANTGTKREVMGKWANTSAQITRVDVVNTGAGDFAVGSEVVVLGHD